MLTVYQMNNQVPRRTTESFCFGDGRHRRVVGPSLESVGDSMVIRPKTAVARQWCLAPPSQLGFSILGSKLFLDLMGELLRGGTRVRFRANGRSMYPSIRDGEVVMVEPVGPSDVKLADIVLYRSERGLIAHRVVGTERKPDTSPTQSSVLSPHHSLTQSSVLSPHYSLAQSSVLITPSSCRAMPPSAATNPLGRSRF